MKMHILRNSLLLLSLLCSSIAGAQNMKVVQFNELTNDLTANRYGTSKTDENGETAALIKIVTPETGFTFDGGSLGIVAVEQKTGEIWVYVPRRAQRLTISHAAFGVLRNYTYPVPVEGAKTYEMLLDIGTGVYATITTPVAKSEVYIDNEFAGTAPIYNRYLNYGKHTIHAVNGKIEGTVEQYVTPDKKSLSIDVDMQDMSHLYGDVRVLVDNQADIFFLGKRVASGLWDTQLKEGSYVVETRKANYEDSKTSFTVKRGEKQTVNAIAPSPYTGYLSVYTRPQGVSAIDEKGRYIDLTEHTPLLVGSHQFRFEKKGYVEQMHEYTIERNQVVKDTVELVPIQYFKDFAFYFGGGYTLRSLSGLTAMAGFTYRKHDLQLSYTFGLSQSDAVNIYDADWQFVSRQKYKMSSLAVRYGYLIELTRKMAIVPQLGYMQSSVSAEVQEGSETFGDGASTKALTVGVKLLAVPMKHLYVFAAPEIGIAMGKDESLDKISSQAGFSLGGFGVTVGLMATF
jgi:hypothetical protein